MYADKISKSSGLVKFQDYDDFEEYVEESHDNRYEWKLRVSVLNKSLKICI